MTARKLPDSYEEKPFIKGYLHDQLETGRLPEFEYKSNRLPATSGKIREIESSFAAIRESGAGTATR